MEDAWPYLALLAGLFALGIAAFFFIKVNREPPGNEVMVELMTRIREGAYAFLKAEYRWIAVFVAIMFLIILLAIDGYGAWGSVTYLFGAFLSASAGVIGMQIATAANARTTEAARSGGAAKALPVAFRGGAVMGFTVAGLGLFGLSLVYILFSPSLVDLANYSESGYANFTGTLATFGLGGSSIALFARVGGGIYTKAADVGADLVGKVEAGIPEDDPRNPATIADNVGDNVGDVAGMGADLFESYVGSIVGPIVLAVVAFSVATGGNLANGGQSGDLKGLVFPISVAAVGILLSFFGTFFVKAKDVSELAKGLHRGPNVASILQAVAIFVLAFAFFNDHDVVENPAGLGLAVLSGLIAGVAIGRTSEYYTSAEYSPVKQIAKQAATGPATVIIKGIAIGMISTGVSVLLIGGAIGCAYFAGEWAGDDLGLYAVALAALGMLSTTAIVVSVDAYGPISDNAGGIAEMAKLPPEVRKTTDALDALGNTTAAIAKGFAIGSAALTGLALFQAFQQTITESEGSAIVLEINRVDVFIGLIVGAMFPFVFAALTMDAVGRAANKMIEEVRRQFREIPGLREGKEGVRPDSAKCVAISTDASLKEMVIPGVMAIATPIAFGIISVHALGGFLAGSLVTGFCMAVFMANAGGAWDNAKKYIEEGHEGGKGSDSHKAAVAGDTVGDPFKDTSGPAMNILLKVMSIVSLIFVPLFI